MDYFPLKQFLVSLLYVSKSKRRFIPTIKLCLRCCYENMISLVYCCVCLFIVTCQSQNADTQGYTNASPYIIPEENHVRIKIGTDHYLKCKFKHHKEITWEFKRCGYNYKGIDCDNSDNQSWIRLEFNKNKARLLLINSTEQDIGMYRCLDNGLVRKVFVVEVVVNPLMTGPSPKIESLILTNTTDQQSVGYTILCNITSAIPPIILWFKKCNGYRCDIISENVCFCNLKTIPSYTYSSGSKYLSKINIFNAGNFDGGLYACLAVSEYGKDYKSVLIDVPIEYDSDTSYPLLFVIPVMFILIIIFVWVCYYNKKKKCRTTTVDQQKRLIKPLHNFNDELK